VGPTLLEEILPLLHWRLIAPARQTHLVVIVAANVEI
jgi:hypothetical protein